MMEPRSGTERLTTAAATKRTSVPMRNESAAASAVPPTTSRNWLLMANCVGAAIPAASATGSSKSHVILFTLLSAFAASAGLVYIEEDRLQAVLADAGAVLDVAGTLKVGEG